MVRVRIRFGVRFRVRVRPFSRSRNFSPTMCFVSAAWYTEKTINYLGQFPRHLTT